MFRTLKCEKDAYITSKIVQGQVMTGSNTGQAGTLDLYKLYGETYYSGSYATTELSRLFVKFEIDPLREVTGSIFNFADSGYKCYLNLYDIYGGQTTPSNFSVVCFPLAKEFSEGRGLDVVAYRDLDSVNWLTASVVNGATTAWVVSGANSGSSLVVGSPYACDYFASISFDGGSTYAFYGVSQSFERGDEDLRLDVTQYVSGILAGYLPDYGFRLSFVAGEETDTKTRFVKRFASRHVRDPFYYPTIDVLYDTSILDQTNTCYFDYSNRVFTYNTVFGSYRNFFDSSSEITGSNCMVLNLVASKSFYVTTSSWSPTHSMSITHTTKSVVTFSQSFSASQYYTAGGTYPLTGTYYSTVFLSSSNATITTLLGTEDSLALTPYWQNVSGTRIFTTGSAITFKRIKGSGRNVAERNFVTNMTNLKDYYTSDEVTRLRFFVQDYNTELSYFKVPVNFTSEIYECVHWRLLHAFTREVLVPFDLVYDSTKLSSDSFGMWFDFWMEDLEPNQIYEFEFMIRENGQDYYILNQGYRFKIIP